MARKRASARGKSRSRKQAKQDRSVIPDENQYDVHVPCTAKSLTSSAGALLCQGAFGTVCAVLVLRLSGHLGPLLGMLPAPISQRIEILIAFDFKELLPELGVIEVFFMLAGCVYLSMIANSSTRAVAYYDVVDPVSPDDFEAAGLGPLGPEATGGELYLDLIKRSLTNLIYYESSAPIWHWGVDKQYRLLNGFDLQSRVRGEDMPQNAMTMIGLRRLNNIQRCMFEIAQDGVEGDLLEAGSCKGGAVIFMRAVLRALGDTERVCYACDTFVKHPPPSNFLVHGTISILLWLLGVIPVKGFQRWLCKQALKVSTDFPMDDAPSDDEVAATVFMLRNAYIIRPTLHNLKGFDAVCSHFARYGLFDDQVKLLRGWFSETIPKANIGKLALLRLDGDSYPSTMDALNNCYPKLAEGGFCIVDDYYSIEGCRRAVDEYRKTHNIDEEIVRIDGLSMYWRRRSDS